MKGRVVVLGRMDGRCAAASILNGELDDFLIEPRDPGLPVPGAIYRAVVDRRIKGMGGVFVRLPGGNGFMRRSGELPPGRSLPVQVTGHAENGKAAPVTARILFKSRHVIVTPGAPGLNVSRAVKDDAERVRLAQIARNGMQDSPHGLIVRSSADGANEEDIASDVAATRDLAERTMANAAHDGPPELLLDGPDPHRLAWREWGQADCVADGDAAFDDHEIRELLAPFLAVRVRLPGDATMFVESTHALIAVDVNTGGDTTPAASLKANLAAAHELPRQLRIRGLGGAVVVDFAPMPKRDRPRLEQALRSAFRSDSVETALVGWTALGHFELQRKRERLALTENPPR